MFGASIVATIQAGGAEAAVALASSDEPAQALKSLSAGELEQFWQALTPVVGEALEAAEPAMESDEGEDAPADDDALESAISTLHAVALLAHACLSDGDRQMPTELHEVALALHDLIFDLTDPRASDLQASIVDLCEAWWQGEHDGRDELVPQTISYLLVRALHELATSADVKRLYGFRSALQVLDYADESVAPLKRLLLHCAIRPLVLRCAEGRKLIAYIFGLHAPFIAELHRAIKTQIPNCRKSQREHYGEVYFRAWRASSGEYLSKVEEDCIQDLMFHAVHASSTAMATALRQILSYTHEQKRQRGVDPMLLRLWEPILWRSLQVANPNVRRNAATLFIEAFPLQDTAMPAVELDGLLQTQFDYLHKLLKDDSVGVRVVGVHGVCRVLAIFWDLIPTTTAKALISTLVKGLAHDAAANTVRVAVLVGIKYLLTQNSSAACVALLKPLLGPLAPLIHDGSERVRASMLELCLALAKIRGLHWQHLIQPEDVLSRLPHERANMQLRITRLLLPLYLPTGKPAAQIAHVSRFAALILSASPAARHLLAHAPRFATSGTSLRLLRHAISAIVADTTEPAALLTASSPCELPPRSTPLPPAQLAACLECIAIFVDAFAPSLTAEERAGDGAGMSLAAVLDADVMALLTGTAKTSILAQRSISRIAAWLPAKAVPHLAAGCLSQIAGSPPTASSTRLAPLIACACAWGQDAALLELVASALGTSRAPSEAGAKRNRHLDCEMSVKLALRVLWAAMTTTSTREALIDTQYELLVALQPLLAKHAASAANASSVDGEIIEVEDGALLALSCHLQLRWHLAAHATEAAAAARALTHTMPSGKRAGARETKASKAAAEAEAAEAKAAMARAAACSALNSAMEWTTSAANSSRRAGVDAPPTALGDASNTEVLVEASPGEARPRTRPRTGGASGKAIDERDAGCTTADTELQGLPATFACRLVACAWIAEGSSLGMLNMANVEPAVNYLNQALLATSMEASAESNSMVMQLFPHVCKMILTLAEPASAVDGGLSGELPAFSTTQSHLTFDLLFTLLNCTSRSAEAAKASRPLLLELLLLAQQQPSSHLMLLVRRLFGFVMRSLPQTADKASSTSVGGGSSVLGLPPVPREVLDVLMLRSAGSGPVLLPALEQMIKTASDADDVPTLDALSAMLLACGKDLLARAELPGRQPLRRAVEALVGRCGASLLSLSPSEGWGMLEKPLNQLVDVILASESN